MRRYQEKFYFNPGDTGFKVFHTKFANIGVAVCWDQWFPEAARAMALQGAEVHTLPHGFPTLKSRSLHSGVDWPRIYGVRLACGFVLARQRSMVPQLSDWSSETSSAVNLARGRCVGSWKCCEIHMYLGVWSDMAPLRLAQVHIPQNA